MAKNHSAKHTHHVKLAGKRITHMKDVGKALEIIYVPRGPDKIKTPAMTQMVKENPKSSITQNIRLSPTHFKKSLNQKTTFATTPNTCLYHGSTIRHIRSSDN